MNYVNLPISGHVKMRQLSPIPLPAHPSVSVRPHGMQELLRAQATMWKMSSGTTVRIKDLDKLNYI